LTNAKVNKKDFYSMTEIDEESSPTKQVEDIYSTETKPKKRKTR